MSESNDASGDTQQTSTERASEVYRFDLFPQHSEEKDIEPPEGYTLHKVLYAGGPYPHGSDDWGADYSVCFVWRRLYLSSVDPGSRPPTRDHVTIQQALDKAYEAGAITALESGQAMAAMHRLFRLAVRNGGAS